MPQAESSQATARATQPERHSTSWQRAEGYPNLHLSCPVISCLLNPSYVHNRNKVVPYSEWGHNTKPIVTPLPCNNCVGLICGESRPNWFGSVQLTMILLYIPFVDYIYSSTRYRPNGSKEENKERKSFMMFASCASICLLMKLEANTLRVLDIFPILDRIPANTVYDLSIPALLSQ